MVLLRSLAALLLSAGLAATAAEPSPHAIDAPRWFANSFLDFREEVQEAARQRRRVMLYFGQDGCPYCKRLMEVNLADPRIAERMRTRFVSIALNLWGDRETTWIDGKVRSEKELGRFLKVQFTPTLIFLDERGASFLRINGYQAPERFRLALDFEAQYPAGAKTLEAFLRARPAQAPAPAPSRLFRAPPLDDKRPLTLLLFEDRSCETCAELQAAFARPEIAALLGRFDAIRLEVHGERRVRVQSDETEAALARALSVTFAPTLVFVDGSGRELFRVEGYLRPFHLAAALDYVASGAHRSEPSFQRFVQARAERERAAGRAVELW